MIRFLVEEKGKAEFYDLDGGEGIYLVSFVGIELVRRFVMGLSFETD